MATFRQIPYDGYVEYPVQEMKKRAAEFYADVKRRRTIRDFSDRPVAREIIENCLRAAATAPNGANFQPWHFAVVESPSVKREIRRSAEKEEKEFYGGRAPEEWLRALEPLGTDESKPFLETAPYLIAIFSESYVLREDGSKRTNYYAKESVGIASGILITALQCCGLATLTHTPSPMNFLNQLLKRPPNEKPFLLLVAGYPAENVRIPALTKKPLEQISSFI